MPAQTWVSDEVWSQLDPSLTRLPRRTRAKVAAGCLAAALAIVAVLVTTASGLIVHRLTVGIGDFAASGSRCSVSWLINNNGWFDEHVLSTTFRPNGTGATLTKDLAEQTIPSGGSTTVRLQFAGAICDQTGGEPIFQNGGPTPELVLRLSRPWGVSTDVIALAQQSDIDGLTVEL